MNILIEETSGSGNWITADETKPRKTKDGTGRIFCQASWCTKGGRAEITPIIVYNDDHQATVLVGYRYSGKYQGGSQYYRHYRTNADGWQRVVWKQYTDPERLLVLDAFRGDHVPGWANVPGKITLYYDNNPKNPHRRVETDNAGGILGYKFLDRAEDGTLSSLFGNRAAWVGGGLTADQPPLAKNQSGIYAAKTIDSPALDAYKREGRALVRLILSGVVIEHTLTYRAERADILEVLQ